MAERFVAEVNARKKEEKGNPQEKIPVSKKPAPFHLRPFETPPERDFKKNQQELSKIRNALPETTLGIGLSLINKAKVEAKLLHEDKARFLVEYVLADKGASSTDSSLRELVEKMLSNPRELKINKKLFLFVEEADFKKVWPNAKSSVVSTKIGDLVIAALPKDLEKSLFNIMGSERFCEQFLESVESAKVGSLEPLNEQRIRFEIFFETIEEKIVGLSESSAPKEFNEVVQRVCQYFSPSEQPIGGPLKEALTRSGFGVHEGILFITVPSKDFRALFGEKAPSGVTSHERPGIVFLEGSDELSTRSNTQAIRDFFRVLGQTVQKAHIEAFMTLDNLAKLLEKKGVEHEEITLLELIRQYGAELSSAEFRLGISLSKILESNDAQNNTHRLKEWLTAELIKAIELFKIHDEERSSISAEPINDEHWKKVANELATAVQRLYEAGFSLKETIYLQKKMENPKFIELSKRAPSELNNLKKIVGVKALPYVPEKLLEYFAKTSPRKIRIISEGKALVGAGLFAGLDFIGHGETLFQDDTEHDFIPGSWLFDIRKNL